MGPESDTESLLARVARGDKAAIELLLGSQRGRLKKMIICRMDHRLAARFDPSDVVQNSLLVGMLQRLGGLDSPARCLAEAARRVRRRNKAAVTVLRPIADC